MQLAQRREQQLVQAREGELRLRLDPDSAQYPKAPGVVGRVLEQGGLADPRVAPQDQRPAVAVPDIVEQLSEPGTLTLPANQHGFRV